MGLPPTALPTATPPPEQSDKTSFRSQTDTPTLTTPMARANPPSLPAANTPTETDVSTPAAQSTPLVLKFSRKDRPGVTLLVTMDVPCMRDYFSCL